MNWVFPWLWWHHNVERENVNSIFMHVVKHLSHARRAWIIHGRIWRLNTHTVQAGQYLKFRWDEQFYHNVLCHFPSEVVDQDINSSRLRHWELFDSRPTIKRYSERTKRLWPQYCSIHFVK